MLISCCYSPIKKQGALNNEIKTIEGKFIFKFSNNDSCVLNLKRLDSTKYFYTCYYNEDSTNEDVMNNFCGILDFNNDTLRPLNLQLPVKNSHQILYFKNINFDNIQIEIDSLNLSSNYISKFNKVIGRKVDTIPDLNLKKLVFDKFRDIDFLEVEKSGQLVLYDFPFYASKKSNIIALNVGDSLYSAIWCNNGINDNDSFFYVKAFKRNKFFYGWAKLNNSQTPKVRQRIINKYKKALTNTIHYDYKKIEKKGLDW